jgi:hypothetical protein
VARFIFPGEIIMAMRLSIETVAHDSFDLGEFPTKEAAAAKVQEMITVYQEIDVQVGEGLRWENWNDVPMDLKTHDRCCFESDMPVLTDIDSNKTWWWSEDTNNFEDPEFF